MRILWLLLPVLLLTPPGLPQGGRIPIPPGVKDAERASAQTEQSVPPPIEHKRTIDSAKLQKDADELADLAASVPSAVNQTTHGVMPKGIVEKLKRIEKLAKHLRSELNP